MEYFSAGSPQRPMDLAEYDASRRSLAEQFEEVCGDVYCEGDYPNLTALALDCSVHVKNRRVGQCLWSFAGSYPALDARTGRFNIHRKTFVCDLGVQGTVSELAAFLRAAAKKGMGHDGLSKVTVPGTSKTLMALLTGCL